MRVQRSSRQWKLRNQHGNGKLIGGRECLRPMIVPILQTKGMIAYAFAATAKSVSGELIG